MIVIINHGLGNIGSLTNALKLLKIEYVVWCNKLDSENIDQKDGFILPGVGSFDAGMNTLRTTGLDEIVLEMYEKAIPGMGICLGMQMLCESSDEGKMGVKGLGIFKGNIEKLDTENDFVPNMGWNHTFSTAETEAKDRYFGKSFYYVHSYGLNAKDKSDVIATFKHGSQDVTAAIKKDNLMGVQFHPEKSQAAGLAMLQNFFIDK